MIEWFILISKLTIVAVWESVNNLCTTTADKMIRDLFFDYLFVFLNVYVLFGGEHATVCVGREHGEPLLSL